MAVSTINIIIICVTLVALRVIGKVKKGEKMKVSAYLTMGDYSKSLDVEFNSENESDCIQADKYILPFIRCEKSVSDEIEVVEDANT